MVVVSQPTQIFSRKQLTSAQTPAYIADAEAQLGRRDFAAARHTLEAGLAAHGPSVEALLGLAEACWDDPDTTARDPKRSIDSLKEAIRLAPKDARPYALLGRYLLSKGLRDQALNFLDRAIQLDPQDGASRRLRDRASLQKQKQYTVVANAKDLLGPQDLEDKEAKASTSSPAAQAKKEVTRFLQFDPARAADVLEKAEAAEKPASIDDALGALLGSGLVNADTSLLRAQRVRRATGLIGRIVGVALMALLGAGLGFGYQKVLPARVTALDSDDAVLDSASPAALARFVERADAEQDPEQQVMAALGHALLVADHGADDSHVESAEQRLRSLPTEWRGDPRALLARSLIAGHPIAEADPGLDEELRQALSGPLVSSAGSQWLALALAARRWTANDPGGVVAALSPWSLRSDSLGRVDLELARAFAAQDEDVLALEVLARLAARLPHYLPAHTLAVALDFHLLTVDAPLGTDENGGDENQAKPRFPIQARPSVKAALSAVELPGTEPLDVVPLAIVMAAIASALEDHELEGVMRQRAQETGGLQRNPGLLRALNSLFLVNLGDFQRAIQWLEEGITRYPASIELLTDLTRAKVAGGLQDVRVRQLRMNAARSIDHEGIRLPLGTLRFTPRTTPVPLTPRFDPSIFPEESIRAALELEDITPAAAERRLGVVVNLKLAELELATGNHEAALNQIERARKAASSNPEVRLLEALVHEASGDAADARDAIEEALRLATGDPHVLLAAAKIQLASGDTTAAVRSLALIKEEGIYSPSLSALESRILREGRRFREARSLIDEARKIAPTDAAPLAEGVLVEHADGQFGAALELATLLRRQLKSSAVASLALDGTVKAYLALADATLGNYDAATSSLKLLVEAEPGLPEAQYVLGKVHEIDGDTETAKGAYQAALELGASGAFMGEIKSSLRRLGADVPERKPAASKRANGLRKAGRGLR